MSAFICDMETINVLAQALVNYMCRDITCAPLEGMPPVTIDKSETIKNVGNALLKANYDSVNCRYNENKEPEPFEFIDVEIDEGIIDGCIACFEYQACEVNKDYSKSNIHRDLTLLRSYLLDSCLRKLKYKQPYGYFGHDMLEDY